MNILVSGGCGFIGSSLVDELICSGHRVTVVDNLSTGVLEYLNPMADFYRLNLKSRNLKHVFKSKNFDVVFHMAFSVDRNPLFVDSNEYLNSTDLSGTLNLLENMKAFGVNKIIFPSSISMYNSFGKDLITEDSIITPVTHYAKAKYKAESCIIEYCNSADMDYTILRYGSVFGLKQSISKECTLVKDIWHDVLNKNIKTEIFEDMNQYMNFIYILDVVNALIKSIDKGNRSIINIGMKQNATIEQFRIIMDDILNKSIKTKEYYMEKQTKDVDLNLSLAFHILGWEPKYSLIDGIEHMYNEYLTESKHFNNLFR